MEPQEKPELEDLVAQAIYRETLLRSQKEVDALEFDMSDAVSVFKKLAKESDTGISIISSAFFDDCLKRLFLLLVGNSEKKVRESLFHFDGPLGTFSSRITVARGFKFISSDTYKRINAIRKIRNDFAHDPFGITFNTEKIKNKVNAIPLDHREFIIMIRKSELIRNHTKPPSRLTLKEEYLVKSALSLSFMASEMIAFPIAYRNRVAMKDLLANFDDEPENIKNIKRQTAECIFEIFKSNKK